MISEQERNGRRRRPLHAPATFDGAAASRSLDAGWHRALRAHPEELRESFYVFAGQSVRFRVVGERLDDWITAAFRHLRCVEPPRRRPRLTVDLWSEDETGVASPVPLASAGTGWFQTVAASQDQRFLGQHVPHTFACLDRDEERITGCARFGTDPFAYEWAKPLSRLLLQWHDDRDVPIVHAALVARTGRGVLLGGPSGSGKTTAALACLCAGFDYVGEDFVGLEGRPDGAWVGHALYGSAFLSPEQLARLPLIAPFASSRRPDESKQPVILSRVFPGRLISASAIDLLLLPRVAPGRGSRVVPASRGEALLRLGPSSLLQIAGRRARESFDTIARCVERRPCYRLEVGSDLEMLTGCVDDLLTHGPALER